jgi:hypothetical protein
LSRQKTLTVKNKNLNFQYFLSPSIKMTYKHNGHSGKSRNFISISFDFSTKIWYNTHMLARWLTGGPQQGEVTRQQAQSINK